MDYLVPTVIQLSSTPSMKKTDFMSVLSVEQSQDITAEDAIAFIPRVGLVYTETFMNVKYVTRYSGDTQKRKGERLTNLSPLIVIILLRHPFGPYTHGCPLSVLQFDTYLVLRLTDLKSSYRETYRTQIEVSQFHSCTLYVLCEP